MLFVCGPVRLEHVLARPALLVRGEHEAALSPPVAVVLEQRVQLLKRLLKRRLHLVTERVALERLDGVDLAGDGLARVLFHLHQQR